MSGLRTCVVVLCGAMVNAAIASPKIETRGELGKFIGGGVGGFVGDKIGGAIGVPGGPWSTVFGAGIGGGIGAYSGAEIGDRVEDFIREPTYDRHFVYIGSFGQERREHEYQRAFERFGISMGNGSSLWRMYLHNH